jgi:hypothetical protein
MSTDAILTACGRPARRAGRARRGAPWAAARAVPRARLAAAGAALWAAVAAAPAAADHPRALLAQTPAGDKPNAPATNPAISGDGRVSRHAAFASAATDIAPGTDGAHSNVFLVRRAQPWSLNGTFWRMQSTLLVTRGAGGGPANGDSWGPAFDGYDYAHGGREITVASKCLAFVSRASNLVKGDDNGRADVFIKRLPGGPLKRIAGPGGATGVDLDGSCKKVAYAAGGTIYVANTNGRGPVRRASARGGAADPELSANGKIVVFERSGSVFVFRSGQKPRRIAAGTSPSADQWGKDVSFVSGGRIAVAKLEGAPRVRRTAEGGSPSMTAGGTWVFWVTGSEIDSTSYRRPSGCEQGAEAREVMGSPHGNYAVFSCSSGEAYMTYIGPR